MTYARKNQVSLGETPYYHVVARCVRRAWLWGIDDYAGRDYSHRKEWVIKRLAQLTKIFSVDVCAYAVMSNHYHLVLHVDVKRAKSWSQEEVARRWTELFSLPAIVHRWLRKETQGAESQVAMDLIERWRVRLADFSWFMRGLNEHLARRANEEDRCKGRFWEGRFRSQALLDESGLLTAMAYVDLNPIRAGIAGTPEASDFTSIQDRIRECNPTRPSPDPESPNSRIRLVHFESEEQGPGIPFGLQEYLYLVDWTGRAVRPDKGGAIDSALPPILSRLNIDGDAWCQAMQPKGNLFGRAIGTLSHLRLHAEALGQSWIRGLRRAERLYG
jgi:REP element-mobilizing transposase RayT